jgi:hypothetical protein
MLQVLQLFVIFNFDFIKKKIKKKFIKKGEK